MVIANIFRNGIEVVASRMTHSHIGTRFDFEQHCVAWSHALDSIQWGAEKPNFVPFPHHDLLDVKSTESLFQQVLDQIEIADPQPCVGFVHSNVINTNNSPKLQPTTGADSTNANLASRSERWRDWSQEQRQVFETKCGEAMSQLGFKVPWQ